MTEVDWPAEAWRLRREQDMPTKEIAALVGRSESQVRKAIAKLNTERAINGRPSSNGNGPHEIPGQTTVDDHLADVPPEDDPEHPDTLADFRGEAGEAVGPMPPQPPAREMDAGDTVYIEDLRVDGTTQFALDLGGALASEAKVTFTGTFPSGFYRKGDEFWFTAKARIVGVAGKDKLDKASGTFRPEPQGHTALIVDLHVE